MTIWIPQEPTQADKGYLLTDTTAILTTNANDRIVFSNWDFYNANTSWDIDNSF